MLISPGEPTPGALGAFAKFGKIDQIRRLEQERVARLWEVHAIVSDHVPLAGDADAALSRPSFHLLHLRENHCGFTFIVGAGMRSTMDSTVIMLGDFNTLL
jgi:hypothetical protein